MNPGDLKDFSQRVGDQLFGHIMPFWCGPALDHEQGGWMGWLSNELKPDRTQPKGLIVNSRILWRSPPSTAPGPKSSSNKWPAARWISS